MRPPSELSELWGPGVHSPPPPVFLDQLILSQPGWEPDHTHYITMCPPPTGYSDLPTALHIIKANRTERPDRLTTQIGLPYFPWVRVDSTLL